MTHNDTLTIALRYIREMEIYNIIFTQIAFNPKDPGLVFFEVTIYQPEHTIPFTNIAKSMGIYIYSRTRRGKVSLRLAGKIYGRKIKNIKP